MIAGICKLVLTSRENANEAWTQGFATEAGHDFQHAQIRLSHV